MSRNVHRTDVIKLYKTLLYLGREYPLGYPYFRERCHRAFSKNREVSDPGEVKRLISHGEFVVKEIIALYSLKKYRTLKRRYYPETLEDPQLAKKLQDIKDLSEKDV